MYAHIDATVTKLTESKRRRSTSASCHLITCVCNDPCTDRPCRCHVCPTHRIQPQIYTYRFLATFSNLKSHSVLLHESLNVHPILIKPHQNKFANTMREYTCSDVTLNLTVLRSRYTATNMWRLFCSNAVTITFL